MKAYHSSLSIIEETSKRVKSSPKSLHPAAAVPRSMSTKGKIPSSPANDLAKHKKSRTKNIASRSAQPIPIPVYETQFEALQSNSGMLSRALNWIRTLQLGRSGTRRLEVVATALLGEKRFVAVIRVDGLEFLIGGGTTNVALLAQLDGKGSFVDLLRKTVTAPKRQNAEPTVEQTSGQA